MRVVIVISVGIALLVGGAGSLSAASIPIRETSSISECLHYTGHRYEACFAYVVNDSLFALRPYYANAHSANPTKAGNALEDFYYRYRSAARQLIASRVSVWPNGENIVAVPRITVIKARSSLVSNSALLVTRETWRVTTTSGRVLYAEKNRRHHISMRRVQGRYLHIWVVTAIR